MKYLHKTHTLSTTHAAVIALTLMTAMISLNSCRSNKIDIQQPDSTAIANADFVTRVNFNRLTTSGLRARVNMSMARGEGRVNVGGRLRMKRNEIIQVSIMPYGLVEVGILEITPDYLLLVDKWGKQYVQAKWKDIKALERANIDFYAFQALFWEELFIPGKKDRAGKDDFDITPLDETTRLQPTLKAASQKDVSLAFVARTLSGLIQQTVVTTPAQSDLRFEWTYSNWTNLEGKDFAAVMTASITSQGKNVQATFKLSSLEADNKMKDIRTNINKDRYTKVDIEAILNRIMSL